MNIREYRQINMDRADLVLEQLEKLRDNLKDIQTKGEFKPDEIFVFQGTMNNVRQDAGDWWQSCKVNYEYLEKEKPMEAIQVVESIRQEPLPSCCVIGPPPCIHDIQRSRSKNLKEEKKS